MRKWLFALLLTPLVALAACDGGSHHSHPTAPSDSLPDSTFTDTTDVDTTWTERCSTIVTITMTCKGPVWKPRKCVFDTTSVTWCEPDPSILYYGHPPWNAPTKRGDNDTEPDDDWWFDDEPEEDET